MKSNTMKNMKQDNNRILICIILKENPTKDASLIGQPVAKQID
ncbi:hypothetical protein [Bacillus chungangensis]|uniref:Uncharacterized protein n=1 Tax=Bacillus chungangensis TaxID=587633 RepID=A0ABT9WUF7_9BACI|nr:hypothetical protein [Bacillus chungangensis]MDQ0176400.1 hypothetical protein [Bacillus chungangensis]